MRKRLVKHAGFFLAFLSIAAFILHPGHACADQNSGDAAHCCVCHTVPIGAARPPVDQTPAAMLVFELAVLSETPFPRVVFSATSPRGPPAA